MTAEEWQQEMKEQMQDEIEIGLREFVRYDDSCAVLEIDYTTQS
tara:strand:- start:1018 stop:1149 length:132 start_codon:yes stop_codon:yes gene_type:complete